MVENILNLFFFKKSTDGFSSTHHVVFAERKETFLFVAAEAKSRNEVRNCPLINRLKFQKLEDDLIRENSKMNGPLDFWVE